jgi:hypothetical protein
MMQTLPRENTHRHHRKVQYKYYQCNLPHKDRQSRGKFACQGLRMGDVTGYKMKAIIELRHHNHQLIRRTNAEIK